MTRLRPAPPPVPYTLPELRAEVVRWNRKADWSIARYELRRVELVRQAAGDEGLLRVLKRDDVEYNEAASQAEFRTLYATRLAATLANELKMIDLGMVGP